MFKSPNTRIQNNEAKARTEDQICAADSATIYLYNWNKYYIFLDSGPSQASTRTLGVPRTV